MDEQRLKAFVEVTESLNFRQAAESLSLSPSALSRRIRELEGELGATLFERDTRRVRLTAAGQEVLPLAVEALSHFNRLRRGTDRLTRRNRALRVGLRAVPFSFRPLLVDVLRPSEADPDIHLEPMESSVQRHRLLTGMLDLAVAVHMSGDPRYQSWPVLQERFVIALPDEQRFRELEVILPEHLDGLRVVSLSNAPASPTAMTSSPLESYHRASAGVVAGIDLIPGGINTLIANGTHCSFIFASDDSPWHRSVVGEGVIVRPLSPDVPPVFTDVFWLAERASQEDLGPVIRRIIEAFPTEKS